MTGAPTLLGVDLAARARSLDPSLLALARSLRDALRPLEQRPFPVPATKAMLTRHGGRCREDGTPLRFDPWSPHHHACPRCARVFQGDDHDAWWALGAQMWCAERTVHAALLGALGDDPALTALAARGLASLGEAWPRYPDRDNALGPTRPFFSTYLESAWLLLVSLATHCLDRQPAHATLLSRLRDEVIAPSRALIASFPEGRSNRQAWHVAARLAASRVLEDDRHGREAVHGPDGLVALLRDGLLEDGSWFEGENYHLFAHRGLWFGILAAADAGESLPPDLLARFDRGFRTPWLGVLPDGTFPSRRDARYAVSVHQWRFAEWLELGLARGDDPLLRRWLQRLYHSPHPAGDTGRARSTGEIERDEPPVALARADLGWRTLLCARSAPWPAPESMTEGSVRLDAQGLVVLRRDAGRLYVALEGGHPGGGHGHPDRLALTIQDGTRRILEDPGTGSYVERTLHWYRSTLAHNAPLVDGASQRRVPTVLRTFALVPEGGLVQADARDVAPGVLLRRSVLLWQDHVLDCVAWVAGRPVQIDLPVHLDAHVVGDARWEPADPGGGGGLEDGFEFLQRVERADRRPAGGLCLSAGDGVAMWGTVRGPAIRSAEIWRAVAPGPPGHPSRRVHWWRVWGAEGMMLSLWSLRGRVQAVRFEGEQVLVLGADARSRRYRLSAAGWDVLEGDPPVGDPWPVAGAGVAAAVTAADLARVDAPCVSGPTGRAGGGEGSRGAHGAARVRAADVRLAPDAPIWTASLGDVHYRRSEETWAEAGAPTAAVSLSLTAEGDLCVTVRAATGEIVGPAPGEANPFDNERPEVNADGVQCHLGHPEGERWTGAWLLVPAPDGRSGRVLRLEATDTEVPVATWAPTDAGYEVTWRLPRRLLAAAADAAGIVAFDLLVNERPPERRRRRGQLVLSGARGEFVYLRGDRHDPRRALRLAGPWRATPAPGHDAPPPSRSA